MSDIPITQEIYMSFGRCVSGTGVVDQILVGKRGRDKYTYIFLIFSEYNVHRVTLKTKSESNLKFFKIINTNAILN